MKNYKQFFSYLKEKGISYFIAIAVAVIFSTIINVISP